MGKIDCDVGGRIVSQGSSDGLEAALQQCRNAARLGYQIAKQNLQESATAIDRVTKSISESVKTFENGSLRMPGLADQLKSQLLALRTELVRLQRQSETDLEERRKLLDSFSITLFGRTMSGKSTLMEILTNGVGESIGQGAQRTTRDVRVYSWNGLRVTDVPGVAAFEGTADEELAFKEASRADLILFLITDDAPQSVEAEWFARVRGLGRPVIGICNIKVAVDDDDDLLLFLRSPEGLFNPARLAELLDQFHALSEPYIPRNGVPFTFTHLRSRFLAQQPEYAQYRDRLLAASKFGEIESSIVREVVDRGKFLRIKSFVDGAAVPMLDSITQLLDYSIQNSATGRVLSENREQADKWADRFWRDGQERITAAVSKLMDSLRDEVPAFAEDHYEDSDAGKCWELLVKSKSTRLSQRVERLLEELLEERNRAFAALARELKSELHVVADLAADRDIKMDPIFDLRRAWEWGTGILSVGLTAATLLGSGPPGWAIAAVAGLGWLLSHLFADHEEESRRARKKLADHLYTDIDRMEGDLRKSLNECFEKELIGKNVRAPLAQLEIVTYALFALAETQGSLALNLNGRLKSMWRSLVEEALIQLGADSLKSLIVDIARVPGFATMFVITPNTTFPQSVTEELERLLGEHIWFVRETKDPAALLAQTIGAGCDSDRIIIDEKIRVAHVPLEDLGAEAKARVRLAQQLTGLHVTR